MKKHIHHLLFASVLISIFSCNGNNDNPTTTPAVPDNLPKQIAYQIINEYPHDTACFTEGLQFVDGKLYESAGNYGKSDIRITDPATGKLLQQKKLDKQYFGEGITVLNGKAYQMTYKENKCFEYDPKTFKLLNTFTYNFGEGWGMTTDGKNLIVSNGSSNIFFMEPDSFKEVKRVDVTNQYGPVANINELEYIKGFIYANIWEKDEIIKIDPATGKVVGNINLTNLRAKYGYPTLENLQENGPEVLNGIAYDSTTNRIFITGKLWPKLFEVKLDN